MECLVTLHALQQSGFSDPLSLVLLSDAPLAPSTDAPADADSWLSLLLDEFAHGVLLINARGTILHANRAARRELACAELLSADDGQLMIAQPEDAKPFQQALCKAVAGKRGWVRMVSPVTGAAFSLALVPLRRQPGQARERIAVFMSRACVSASGLLAAFARSHGLTRTEEKVLVYLCRSLGAPEIATQMKVAVSTVRSHVRSLCAKTSSSGVRELVNRVAVLPPVAAEPLGPIH